METTMGASPPDAARRMGALPRDASRRVKRFLLPLMSLALLVTATGQVAAAEPDGATSTRKMALGVSTAAGLSISSSDDLPAFDAFRDSVGRGPAVWSLWSNWGGADAAFPSTSLLGGLQARGAVPMVFWQPAEPGDVDNGKYRYRSIIAGDHDAYIRAWAQAAKNWGGTVLLRFAPEMNGYWFPWGMERFDNTPMRFKKAWWRIYDIFRGPGGVGATNVKFVWSPIAPCGRCASYSSLYPGDSYVQFASFSAFNWGSPKPWKSMVTKFSPAMSALASVTSKKVIVAETASTTAGGSQAAWVRDGYRAAYRLWPKIKAIVYFNLDMGFADQPDWRLTSASGSLGEYRTLLTKTKFQGQFK